MHTCSGALQLKPAPRSQTLLPFWFRNPGNFFPVFQGFPGPCLNLLWWGFYFSCTAKRLSGSCESSFLYKPNSSPSGPLGGINSHFSLCSCSSLSFHDWVLRVLHLFSCVFSAGSSPFSGFLGVPWGPFVLSFLREPIVLGVRITPALTLPSTPHLCVGSPSARGAQQRMFPQLPDA